MGYLRCAAWVAIIANVSACSTTSSSGRTQWIAPTSVSSVYSTVDMHTQVALSGNFARRAAQSTPQPTRSCEDRAAFEARLKSIGARLSRSVRLVYPQTMRRVAQFDFQSAAGREPLSASSASGTVIIGEGIRLWCLDDEALGFIIAREMGHIVARHHEEDTGTNLFFSIIGQLLLPISTAYAASYAGSYAMRRSYRPQQQREADGVAIQLMASAGWDAAEIADAYSRRHPWRADNDWTAELRVSLKTIERLARRSPRHPQQPVPVPALAVGNR